jgi:SAM-dependent methyltransferase
MTTPLEVFEHALRVPGATLALAGAGGEVEPLPVARWRGRAGGVELTVLEQARGPVLDVGCGPGRHLEALAARGVTALGIDISATAVRLARRRGGRARRASIWDELPGGWGTVLLLDGTIGLDGRPAALLRRAQRLLAPGGRVLVEVADGVRRRGDVRLVGPAGTSAPFAWAGVGWPELDGLAAAGGLRATWRLRAGERGFAALEPGLVER